MNIEKPWQAEPENWRKSYEESGYLVVENAVDSQTLAGLRDALEKIESAVSQNALPDSLRRWIALESDRTRNSLAGEVESDTVSNIMELPIFDSVFADFIIYPRVLDILEALFESREFAFHNYKAICKMPSNKAPFQWHRDLPYLQHTSPNLITCMICVDDMTIENGATEVCPGSHRIAHEEVLATDIDIPENQVPQNRVPVVCPAGSAVLFHVNIIHGGGPNNSETKRRNVIGIWAGPDCHPTTGARYAYEFVKPRSDDAAHQKQIAMTFGAP